MSYETDRACADVLGKLLSYQMGRFVKVRVKPNPDPRKAANEQAQYGLRVQAERSEKILRTQRTGTIGE